jgi:small conductance mechanosensitive channel
MEIEAIIQRIWELVTIYGIKVIAASDDRVLKDPATTIAVVELADNSVNFVFRPWANASDYWNVWFDLTEQVKKRFDEAGISIPYPQRDIHVYEHKD